METARCSCGAAVPRGAWACSLCHAPLAPAEASEASGAGEPGEPPAGPNGFLPAPPRRALRVTEGSYSRVRQGPLSFGPLGRTLISVLVVLPLWFMWFMSGGGLVTLIMVIPTAVLPLWYLRETWRRQRVR